MQIQLSHNQNHRKDIDVTTRDFRLIEGKAGYAVRVGERVVGFSGEDVSAVSLKVAEGRLHIQLQSEAGDPLGEYQIPSTDLLRQDLRTLSQSGIYFSPHEIDELQNLMRLTMSGSVSRQEILLILDEISHLAPNLEGVGTIDAGDVYPDLNQQVRKLMGVMPDDIQRFVILNNMDRFGDDIWNAFHLISKVDTQKHPTMTRFLAGESAFTYVAAAEMKEIAANNPLQRTHPIGKLDVTAFQNLMRQLAGVQVEGDYRTIRFTPPLAKMIFNHFDLTIPDFSAAPTFEELEANFMARLKASHPFPGKDEDPLKKHLLRFLDTSKYKELADFLGGKPGTSFSTEAKEGFLHFLKNPPKGKPTQTPLSIGDKAYDRLLHFARNQKLDIPQLLQNHPNHTMKNDPSDPVFLGQLSKDWGKLNRSERLAMFVLDHLDPVSNSPLFRYFDGGQKGLSKLTPSLERDLQNLITRPRIPDVKGGLTQFEPKRFEELVRFLNRSTQAEAPEDYLPTNPRLRKALYELVGGDEQMAPEPLLESDEPRDLRPRVAPDKLNTKVLAKAILHSITGLRGEARDGRLTMQLKQHLTHFRQVAILDQTWKGERLMQFIQDGSLNPHKGTRELSKTLRQLSGLLGGRDQDPSWDVWRQNPKALKPGQRPTFQEKIMAEKDGLERYFHLDRNLPERADNLTSRVEDLGWMRRMEELASRLDRHRDNNPARLQAALKRVANALEELSGIFTKGGGTHMEYHGDSPLSQGKLKQFSAFRDAVLQGQNPDVSELFEGPFLRSEFSSAEPQQQLEMKRLEPLFKEALSRFETEPQQVLEKLMDALVKPNEVSSNDAGHRIRQLVANLHDFNQHQNLNQQPMYLSLPLKWGEEESEMELAYFRLPGGDKKKRFLVVIHLDFESWGHLRVDVLKDGEQLSATFWVSTLRMSTHLQRDMQRLRDRLAAQGTDDVDLRVKLEPKRAEKPVSQLCLPDHDGEVDVQI